MFGSTSSGETIGVRKGRMKGWAVGPTRRCQSMGIAEQVGVRDGCGDSGDTVNSICRK